MKKIITLCFLLLPVISSLAQNFRKISECVIENGQLKNIIADYDPGTGEKSILVGTVRKKLAEDYPLQGKDYAAGQSWFISSQPVSFNNIPYVKYGLPRILGITEIEKSGVYSGVGVYKEAGVNGLVEVIYIPVRQGCEFQPYQLDCKKVFIDTEGKPTAISMDYAVKITGETEKINYTWSTRNIQLIKGQGTARISVDTKTKEEDDEFKLTVVASAGKKCWYATDLFAVQKISQPTASKWGKTERDEFMQECVPNTKMTEQKGKAYCSCMLEKIIKLWPDPLVAQKEMTQQKLTPMAKECLTGLQ